MGGPRPGKPGPRAAEAEAVHKPGRPPKLQQRRGRAPAARVEGPHTGGTAYGVVVVSAGNFALTRAWNSRQDWRDAYSSTNTRISSFCAARVVTSPVLAAFLPYLLLLFGLRGTAAPSADIRRIEESESPLRRTLDPPLRRCGTPLPALSMTGKAVDSALGRCKLPSRWRDLHGATVDLLLPEAESTVLPGNSRRVGDESTLGSG